MKNMYGYIHSYESFGAVDGPGIRFVVFLKGCILKCLYCHNPDTWHKKSSCNTIKISSQELIDKVLEYKNFISDGGVTISGGEPLIQADFCCEFTDMCHEHGIHTAIDTSGAVPVEKSGKAITKADLILLDIKEIDSDDCRILTGMDNKNTFETLEYCESIKKPVWIRHVLIPEYTLKREKLERLADYLKQFSCIEKTELLPYHTMGRYKWEQLGEKYQLDGIESPSDEEMKNAREIFMNQMKNQCH